MAEENPAIQGVTDPELRSQGREVWEAARERMQTLKRDTESYVRQNPTKAVFTALAVGFVLGLMRRR